MPYSLTEENGRYCVKKGGEVLKCYDDRDSALKYFRALQANVHEGFAQFSMAIIKANADKNGVMRWRAVASDTGEDYYGEKMSVELFKDFIGHINNEDEIPEPFKSVIAEPDWDGGMPYISLAHFKSGEGRVNVPGEPTKIYLDGNVLKSTGIMYDTPLGKAVFKSLQKDLVEKRDDKIRVSIGFLDLEHSHGNKFTFTRKSLADKCPLCKEGVGDKIYRKGYLVHEALTRVPANPRTDMEVEKSMTTKKEDLESIVEDEEVIKGLDLKSQADDALVIKATEDCDEDMAEDKKDGKKEKKPVAEKSVEETPATAETVTQTPAPVYEPTPVEKSFAALVEKMKSVKDQGLTGEAALTAVQSAFDDIGNVIKSEFTPAPSPEEVVAKTMESTLRSLLSEMLPQALAQAVAPIQSELESVKSELRAKSLTAPIKKENVETVQRSIIPSLVQKSALEQLQNKTKSQFQLLAEQTVGLQ